MEEIATKTAVPYMNKNNCNSIPIAIPPTKAEQAAIATALSDVDALISALNSEIAKKRLIKQGAMQELLSGKKRLAGFSEDWDVKIFGEVFDFLTTATYSRADLSESDDIYYIHYGDIHTKWDYFLDFEKSNLPTIKNEQVKKYPLIKDGDIIMADASEDYDGICKSVEVKNIGSKKAISGLHTFLLRDNKCVFENGFKAYIQASIFVKNQNNSLATGLKVYGVSKFNLKTIKILIPPKKEQTAIAQILSDMDSDILALETERNKTLAIKQGMMQELLTGKTRLI
jgi:type I restriction enzyme S subunit